MLETFLGDIKHASRQILRSPLSTTVAVLILGLGIGANVAIFSVVNGVLLRPLPFEHGEDLVLIEQERPSTGVRFLFSVPEISDYRDQNKTLADLVEYHWMWFTLLGRDEPQRVHTSVVSANFFDTFGVKPLLGRSFLPADDVPGAEPVLILSHEYWRSEFGGDPDIVGKTFEMNDEIHTVVGVLPAIPQYPNESHVYMTSEACPFRSGDDLKNTRNMWFMRAFGRIKPGTTIEAVKADFALIAQRLKKAHPEVYDQGEGYSVRVTPVREALTLDAKPTLLALLGMVLLVLLMSCANLASLAFVRMLRREKEMAIRLAIGAKRRRLVRVVLLESILLGLLGGLAALVFAVATNEFLVSFAGRFTTRTGEIAIDLTVVLFTFVVSVVAGIAFGFMPALSIGTDSSSSALREGGGRNTMSVGLKRMRGMLIVIELAVSFVLLIGASLMVRSLVKLQNVDPGFRWDNVLSVEIGLNWSNYKSNEDTRRFFSRLLEKASTLPGVVSAAVSATVPLDEAAGLSRNFEIEGSTISGEQENLRADFRIASPAYFETVAIPLQSGRFFQDTDREDTNLVAIVNQSLAQRYWGDQDVIGRRVSTDAGKTWRTVVGVVGNVKQHGLDREVRDELYVPFRQSPRGLMSLLVKTAGSPLGIAQNVREAVYEIDPEQPVSKVQTLSEVRSRSLAPPRLTAILFGIFAGLALTITVAGVAGVIAFSVSQQTREIGIRMALGARQREVLWAVLRGTVVLFVVGLTLGILSSSILNKMISSLLFEIEANDPVTYIAVSVLLCVVVAMACLLPARRAARVDPVEALRYE